MIPKEDARFMVRLVADVAALRTDHAKAKRYLMNRLKEKIGADCWVWTLGYLHPEKAPVYVCILHDGFGEERFSRFLQASEHPDMMALIAPFAREVMESQRQVTRLRQQIDPEDRFLSSEVYPLWLEANVAPLILSAKPLNEQCVSLIGIYRREDQPLFNEPERQIANILLTEVPWLHAQGWPEDFGGNAKSLSRKRRLVLNLLLEGDSRKTVADKLELSIHTVSEYIKDIYRTFEVQSHAELMRRFTAGH